MLLDLHDDNLPRNSTIGKKKCRIQNLEDSLDLVSSHLKMLCKEDNDFSYREQDITPNQHLHNYTLYFNLKEQENEMDSIFQTDNSFQAWDHPLAQCMPEASKNRENQLYLSDNNSLSAEDCFLVNEVTLGERCSVNADNVHFRSPWGKDSLEVNLGVNSESGCSALCCDSQLFSDDVEMSRDGKKPFLKSCSSRGCLRQERDLYTDSACEFKSDRFKIKRSLTGPYDRINISESDGSNQSSHFLSRNLLEDKSSSFHPFPTAEFGNLERYFVRSIPLDKEHLDKNDGFSSDTVTKVETIGSNPLNLDSEWCFLSLNPISQATPWDVDHYNDINILEDGCKSVKTASIKHFMNIEENDCRYTNDTPEMRSSQEKCTTSCSYGGLADAGSSGFLQRHNFNNKCPPKSINMFTDETDCLSFGSLGKNHIGSQMYKCQRNTYTYQESERKAHFSKGTSRSHSAPPFSRRKRRFFTLSFHSSVKAGNGPAYPGCFT